MMTSWQFSTYRALTPRTLQSSRSPGGGYVATNLPWDPSLPAGCVPCSLLIWSSNRFSTKVGTTGYSRAETTLRDSVPPVRISSVEEDEDNSVKQEFQPKIDEFVDNARFVGSNVAVSPVVILKQNTELKTAVQRTYKIRQYHVFSQPATHFQEGTN